MKRSCANTCMLLRSQFFFLYSLVYVFGTINEKMYALLLYNDKYTVKNIRWNKRGSRLIARNRNKKCLLDVAKNLNSNVPKIILKDMNLALNTVENNIVKRNILMDTNCSTCNVKNCDNAKNPRHLENNYEYNMLNYNIIKNNVHNEQDNIIADITFNDAVDIRNSITSNDFSHSTCICDTSCPDKANNRNNTYIKNNYDTTYVINNKSSIVLNQTINNENLNNVICDNNNTYTSPTINYNQNDNNFNDNNDITCIINDIVCIDEISFDSPHININFKSDINNTMDDLNTVIICDNNNIHTSPINYNQNDNDYDITINYNQNDNDLNDNTDINCDITYTINDIE